MVRSVGGRRSDAGSNAVDVAAERRRFECSGCGCDDRTGGGNGNETGWMVRSEGWRVFEFGGGRYDYRPGEGSGNETRVLMDIIIILLLLLLFLF